MLGKIIGSIVAFGCAILFYSIGVYAQKREKPMWFWSGLEVNDSQIADVERYNKENGAMWKGYSLWFVAAGFAGIWNEIVFLIVLILSCTLGLALLIRAYKRIFEKYRAR